MSVFVCVKKSNTDVTEAHMFEVTCQFCLQSPNPWVPWSYRDQSIGAMLPRILELPLSLLEPGEHCCWGCQSVCDLLPQPEPFCLNRNQVDYTSTEEPILLLRTHLPTSTSAGQKVYPEKKRKGKERKIKESKGKEGKGREKEKKKKNNGFCLSLPPNSASHWHNLKDTKLETEPGKSSLWVSIILVRQKDSKGTWEHQIY